MKEEKIKIIFSEQRLRKFIERFDGDFQSAIALYKLNITISQSFYPLLAIVEITLRNKVFNVLSKNDTQNSWIEQFGSYPELIEEISKAKQIIIKRGEDINEGKLIAELTFGFWTQLFNSKYENELWKPLRLAFSNIPKNKRQRKKVSAPLNRIRKFRNRVFHYEPIIWSISELDKIKWICYELLEWLDEDLPAFCSDLENIDNELMKLRTLYKWRSTM